MASPLISVVLPVFNAEETIPRSIKSILNQSFHDFELIIIINGSTDHTKKKIDQFIDKRIKVFELPDPNLVAALNFGIEQSQGKYIARMDADDFSHETRLELQASFLEVNPDISLVSGKVNYMGNQLENKGYFCHVNWANNIDTPEKIYLSRFQESSLPHPSVMFRKSVGEKYGFYKSGDFPEDFELWNRWLNLGVRMSKVDEIVLDWHDSPYRMSRTHPMYQTGNFSTIKAQYFSQWLKGKFPWGLPQIYVWGDGGSVRQKCQALATQGIKISKFIDIKKRDSDRSIFYKELKFQPNLFVLSYVNNRKGKKEIYKYLLKLGFKEGVGFYMME